jgi:hypothetical protein
MHVNKVYGTALPSHKGIHCYKSAEELWNDYGLSVAMSVLDHPRP